MEIYFGHTMINFSGSPSFYYSGSIRTAPITDKRKLPVFKTTPKTQDSTRWSGKKKISRTVYSD